MTPYWELGVFAPYIVLLGILSLFSLHRAQLAWAARRASPPQIPQSFGWPSVLVQLPLYNERFVARRLIDAVARLNYPGNLRIQVLDDSSDGTRVVVAEAVQQWRAAGRDIHHLMRNSREGYKAGALSYGLARDDSELVAIFDADFVPQADFLLHLVPHFADLKVGMVQARWDHINLGQNNFTEAQGTLLDAHFVNEHGGRQATDCFFNFNGTAGLWRRACIDDAGGWSGRTLTEDLDLSYRAQLRGWRFVYRSDVLVPAELPGDAESFKTQQHRWAKGSIETARCLMPKVWRAPISLRRKVEASFHLLGNLAYPAVVALVLLMPFVMRVRAELGDWRIAFLDILLLMASTGSLVGFYSMALGASGAAWQRYLKLPLALAVGAGLAVNNTRGVLEALLGRRSEFSRTPKRGDHALAQFDPFYFLRSRGWVQASVEGLFGIYILFSMGLAIYGGRYLAVPLLALFAGGFLFLGFGSLCQGLRIGKTRPSGKTLTAPLA